MITNIKVYPTKGDGNTKAFGRFTIAEVVGISFSIVDSKNGLFVSLPSHKGKDKDTGADKYYKDVFIDDKTVYADMQKQCVAAYNKTVGDTSTSDQDEAPGPTSQEAPPIW